jgi:urease accessory protein
MSVRVVSVRRKPDQPSTETLTLAHDARRLRRRLLTTDAGTGVMVDFPETTTLNDGDALELDDGRSVRVIAASEKLYEISGNLTQLAWHLGNRHLPAEIRSDAILIARDPVIYGMLIGLGATVRDVEGPFSPIEGAYHAHGHALLNR